MNNIERNAIKELKSNLDDIKLWSKSFSNVCESVLNNYSEEDGTIERILEANDCMKYKVWMSENMENIQISRQSDQNFVRPFVFLKNFF